MLQRPTRSLRRCNPLFCRAVSIQDFARRAHHNLGDMGIDAALHRTRRPPPLSEISQIWKLRVVFNIKANDYRLITLVQYRDGVLMIRFFGSPVEHDQEYDAINAQAV